MKKIYHYGIINQSSRQMQQKQQLDQVTKNQRYRYPEQPIESLIYQRLKRQGVILEAQTTPLNDKKAPSKIVLPSISQKSIHSLCPILRSISKSQQHIPKINPTLKYHSLKWHEQNNAKNEEQHLYKGKKKLKIETISLSQPKEYRQPRHSMPSKLLSLKKSNHELYTEISKLNSSKKSVKFLPVLTDPEPPKPKKVPYYRCQDVVGWQTAEYDQDSYH